MLVLGVETACDDTSVALVRDGREILSNVTWTQDEVHRQWGGVVPELAARRHVEVISEVTRAALDAAGVPAEGVDLVAVNHQHGLVRSIVVGVAAAKAFALLRGIPLVGVHHIEGHILSALLAHSDVSFPHVCLTVSGGHNLLFHVAGPGKYRLLGRTLDDAAGEAFDKVAKELGLGFPGGAVIDRLAPEGNASAFSFPRPMLESDDFDFSFSGLKTAVKLKIAELQGQGNVPVADLAASFQEAVVDVLSAKAARAVAESQVAMLTVVGGVAANSALRKRLTRLGEERGFAVRWPPVSLCTDNGAMVAAAGYYRWREDGATGLEIGALPNAPIGQYRATYK